ncbi:MAG: hypothetical protein BroJett011_34650 [Chloroflexota bacterium]|nr:MAG: hypothetical protein BroJett011_34650 [Chloroflexota bacterium]
MDEQIGINEPNTTMEEKIAKWLKQQGYPLEMSVAQHFHGAGFKVIQSDFYLDSETGTHREIDVRAERFQRISQSGYVLIMRVGCDIECKLSQEKPWILFTSNDRTIEQSWISSENAVTSNIGDLILYDLDDEVQAVLPSFLDKNSKKRVAYGLTQAFTGGQDVPYKAITSAFKAAVSHATYLDKYNVTILSEPRKNNIYLNIVFPIVVVGGRLFETYLDDNGNLIIQETKAGILHWNGPLANKNNPVIYLFTESVIRELAQIMNEKADRFFAHCAKVEVFNALLEAKKELVKKSGKPE